jgi:hypothetical protein
MTKREFLEVLGAATGATLARPLAAWADRRRILGGEPPILGDPGGAGQVSVELGKLVAGVSVGARKSHGGLHVLWLHAVSAPAPLPIATFEEARDSGELVIAERARASVPGLVVDNRGKAHVLLLAGEILLGGKQNRVVVEDVLLPPRSGPVDLEVYCVEQGRWSQAPGGADFGGRGAFAAPQLRSKVLDKRGQSEVWAEVNRYSALAQARSATGSYQAIYDKPEVQAHQTEVARSMDARRAPGALGAAVFASDGMAGLDLFRDAGLFAREWPKLLRAYALETYDRPALSDVDDYGLRTRLEALLRRLGTVEGTLRRNAGVGRLFEFRLSAHRGSALVAEGRVVHAAVL